MLLFQNNYKWFAIIFFHKHLVRLTFIVAEIYWYRKRIHFCFSPFIVESTSTRHVFTYFWHNKDKLYGEEQNLRYCNTTVANFIYNLSQFSLHFYLFHKSYPNSIMRRALTGSNCKGEKRIRNVDISATDSILKINFRCMVLNSNASVERQMQSKNSYYLITRFSENFKCNLMQIFSKLPRQ